MTNLLKLVAQLRKSLPLVLAIFLLISFTSAPLASTPQRSERVRFAKGKTGTVIKGGVARGESIRYIVGAGRSQTMKVKITSVEKNAVFSITYAENNAELPDAQEVTSWENTLPSAGDYVIEVGTTRGGADFTLSINIE